MGRCRRLAKDVERTLARSLAWTKLAACFMMRRVARSWFIARKPQLRGNRILGRTLRHLEGLDAEPVHATFQHVLNILGNCSPGGSSGYSVSWLRQRTAFPCRAMVMATRGLYPSAAMVCR